jgi:hypothetical protein
VSWSNPPEAVDALRTQILACAEASAAGISSGNIHYPAANIAPDAGSADALPVVVLAETSQTRTKYAEAGVAPLFSGEISMTIHRDTDVGTLEKSARAFALQLPQVIAGLPINSVSVGMCSDPSEGQTAADDGGIANASFRSITMTISYGLGA